MYILRAVQRFYTLFDPVLPKPRPVRIPVFNIIIKMNVRAIVLLAKRTCDFEMQWDVKKDTPKIILNREKRYPAIKFSSEFAISEELHNDVKNTRWNVDFIKLILQINNKEVFN